ncbi:myb-like DNA-binding domain-containing protein [Ditylenchus destructor]|nr:myb-like DNA-binding domain-containing protein [Ditylenchus destructor]
MEFNSNTITENNDDSLHDESLSPLPVKYRPRHRRVISSPEAIDEENETRQEETLSVTEQKATPKNRNRKKNNVSTKSMIEPKEKRWTAQDDRRLKNALKIAVNPKTDEDWKIIAKSVGNNRTMRECREHADRIYFSKSYNLSDLSSIALDSDSEKRPVRKSKSNIEIRKKSAAEADFFGSQQFEPDASHCFEIDPDDSLLLALSTPKEKPAKNMRKPFIMTMVTSTPRNVLTDNSPEGDY